MTNHPNRSTCARLRAELEGCEDSQDYGLLLEKVRDHIGFLDKEIGCFDADDPASINMRASRKDMRELEAEIQAIWTKARR